MDVVGARPGTRGAVGALPRGRTRAGVTGTLWESFVISSSRPLDDRPIHFLHQARRCPNEPEAHRTGVRRVPSGTALLQAEALLAASLRRGGIHRALEHPVPEGRAQ